MVFGSKPRSSVEVRFDGGRNLGDMVAFKPGERIQGTVTVTPEDDVNAEGITVGLMWFTQGRGDMDQAVVQSVTRPGGFLTGGVDIRIDFDFTAPQEPWSYAGKLINIVWAIQVVVDPERGRMFTASQPLVISPRLEAHTPPAPPV